MLPDVGFLFLLHSIKEVWQQPCDEIINSAVFFLPTEEGQRKDTFLGQGKMLDRKDFKGEKILEEKNGIQAKLGSGICEFPQAGERIISESNIAYI